ncbi:MAG: hypothetical protein DID92_2727744129 [Candidatus Nitrotoga sp. SPKER]|nr:MAG: hypothetical protein DID92_2727744129 [Candidatus Nitrotoga sp. SPKER]
MVCLEKVLFKSIQYATLYKTDVLNLVMRELKPLQHALDPPLGREAAMKKRIIKQLHIKR